MKTIWNDNERHILLCAVKHRGDMPARIAQENPTVRRLDFPI